MSKLDKLVSKYFAEDDFGHEQFKADVRAYIEARFGLLMREVSESAGTVLMAGAHETARKLQNALARAKEE